MEVWQRTADSIFDISSRTRRLVLLFLAILATLLTIVPSTPGQTLTVLHNFTGGADGSYPAAGVTLDQQGRIYGTTTDGGKSNRGVVYRLVRGNEGWVLSPIHWFGGPPEDGATPGARVVFGPDGLLYGTTNVGGAYDYGTVFSLRPPATACTAALCPWIETILYTFTGGADGGNPYYGDLVFDRVGNIYGTTNVGGLYSKGVVFALSPSGSGWTESVIWNFTGGSEGGNPFAGVIFDNAGNLYGTTGYGGANRLGAVYELSPTQSGWRETTIYTFTSDDNGGGIGGLIMDAHGDLFGVSGGDELGGAAYELTPQNGSWSFNLLQTFTGDFGPIAPPTFDAEGNLYGPLPFGGQSGKGEVFRLTPSGGQWLYTSYYQFNSDSGTQPDGAVIFDSSGNMYGTNFVSGADNAGTVWEITP